MNRYQRNYDRATTRTENRAIDPKNKKDIEEVLPPRERRKSAKSERFKSNRSCNVRPSQKDKSLITDDLVSNDEHTKLIWTQYDLDPSVQEKTIKEGLSKKTYIKTTGCQYVDQATKPATPLIESDECHWQIVNNVEDLDNILSNELDMSPNTSKLNNVHISQEPRIKSIAQKFAKFKKNDVELRKLEEKIVCVEYDVFPDDLEETTPVQTMRAFFSVKPTNVIDKENEVLVLQSLIKRKFHITEDDLGNLKEKEIEVIDAKLPENKPYIDDLKRVLERKRAIYEKKNKSTLDLMFLYEMAKRERPSDENYSDTNFLSKAELEEIKNLITTKCASSVHGIRRKTVKSENENIETKGERDTNISESIYAELTRNFAK